MVMFVPTTGDVIVYRTDPSLTIEFDAFPKDSPVFAVSHSIVGITVVHEGIASLAGRHILATFSSSHEAQFLLLMTISSFIIIFMILQ